MQTCRCFSTLLLVWLSINILSSETSEAKGEKNETEQGASTEADTSDSTAKKTEDEACKGETSCTATTTAAETSDTTTLTSESTDDN